MRHRGALNTHVELELELEHQQVGKIGATSPCSHLGNDMTRQTNRTFARANVGLGLIAVRLATGKM